jgi:hypothetical protein
VFRRGSLRNLIINGFTEMRGLIMSAQDDINAAAANEQADAAALTTALTTIGTAVTGVQAEIAALDAQIAAGGQPNTTALNAANQALTDAFAGLGTAVSSVSALVPAPTPPPAV